MTLQWRCVLLTAWSKVMALMLLIRWPSIVTGWTTAIWAVSVSALISCLPACLPSYLPACLPSCLPACLPFCHFLLYVSAAFYNGWLFGFLILVQFVYISRSLPFPLLSTYMAFLSIFQCLFKMEEYFWLWYPSVCISLCLPFPLSSYFPICLSFRDFLHLHTSGFSS